MYNSIVFDLGGVIEKINPIAVIQEFTKLGMKDAENFFSLFKQSAICTAFELGYMHKKEFIRHLQSLCRQNSTVDDIEYAWCANQLGISKNTMQVLTNLNRKKIKLFVLSNTNPIHAQIIESIFFGTYQKHLKDFFDFICYSFEMHLRKPDVNAYEYLLKRANLIPKRCIYIDDIEENLAPMKKLGAYCVHHKTNDEISNIGLLKKIMETPIRNF